MEVYCTLIFSGKKTGNNLKGHQKGPAGNKNSWHTHTLKCHAAVKNRVGSIHVNLERCPRSINWAGWADKGRFLHVFRLLQPQEGDCDLSVEHPQEK